MLASDTRTTDNRATRRYQAGRCSFRAATPRPPASTPVWACRGLDLMIYFNTDASYRDGWAGIAYDTNGLGRHRQLVPCHSSSEAEIFAVLLAMEVADQAHLTSVLFRTDFEAARPTHPGRQPAPSAPTRTCPQLPQATPRMGSSSRYPRRENVLANRLARDALKALSDVPVTVTVNSTVASALIQRAGIPATADGRWRVSEAEDPAGLDPARSARPAGCWCQS